MSAPNAYVEQRDNGRWVVVYGGTVVGRHTAQYKAREQADALNAPEVTWGRVTFTIDVRIPPEGDAGLVDYLRDQLVDWAEQSLDDDLIIESDIRTEYGGE